MQILFIGTTKLRQKIKGGIMKAIPSIAISNLKESQDAYTLIDLLKAGYKQTMQENNETKKLFQRNNNFSDIKFAQYLALENSFKQTIVLLEELEKKIELIDRLNIHAEEMAGGF